jgi:DNA polymerase III alpha subunit (gram-positive type)
MNNELLEIIEKNKEKDIIKLMADDNNVNFEFEHYICPNCKIILEQRIKGAKTSLYTPKYCHDCGQKLNWSN